ncbi:D-amino-acid transaminase [Alteribacillus iranensis]|uniref:D-alanine aminotransferase n=1 Tax=Alteribacillus iranensis TaxID=930128 RepID=A0A1I1ZGE5_9BACI|nr:D-amino-acid transaminase [Alteribacillus iranensis]SFE30652.1 D-alanine transaminase [Alteribacillus iranensis]
MEYVWLDDKMIKRRDAKISFDDRGYYFGDGIYEVIRIYESKPFLWKEHMERFSRSAKEMDLSLPYSPEETETIVTDLIHRNNLQDGFVYFQVTRGIQPRDHLYTRDLKPVLTAFTREAEVPVQNQKNGIHLWVLEDIRWLRCDIKTINLLGNIMAKRKAEDNSCQEALQHREGVITEGSSSNIFFVKDGTLYTHPANHYILNGITRQHVVHLANARHIPVEEKAFTLQEASEADEIFITSTVQEIIPVTELKGEMEASFSPGPITRELQDDFRQSVQK